MVCMRSVDSSCWTGRIEIPGQMEVRYAYCSVVACTVVSLSTHANLVAGLHQRIMLW